MGTVAYRCTRLTALNEQVLEVKDVAREWLREKQVGLGWRSPMEVMRTEAGAREVEKLLVNIEHGQSSVRSIDSKITSAVTRMMVEWNCYEA